MTTKTKTPKLSDAMQSALMEVVRKQLAGTPLEGVMKPQYAPRPAGQKSDVPRTVTGYELVMGYVDRRAGFRPASVAALQRMGMVSVAVTEVKQRDGWLNYQDAAPVQVTPAGLEALYALDVTWLADRLAAAVRGAQTEVTELVAKRKAAYEAKQTARREASSARAENLSRNDWCALWDREAAATKDHQFWAEAVDAATKKANEAVTEDAVVALVEQRLPGCIETVRQQNAVERAQLVALTAMTGVEA